MSKALQLKKEQKELNITLEPSVAIEIITPTLAEKLLSNNPLNRNLNEDRVLRYRREMEEGRWQFNGESVKICDDGSLIDGQHRLAAIVKTQISQKSIIVRNLPREVFSTIDLGRTRTLTDLLNITGYQYADKMSGAIRLISMLNENKEIARSKIKCRSNYTIDELFSFIKQNASLQDDILYAHSNFSTLIKKAGSPIINATFYLFKQKDEALAMELMNGLNTGYMLDGNSVIYHCREAITAHREAVVSGRYSDSGYLLYLIVKTWNLLRSNTYDIRYIVDHSMPIPVIN